MTGKCYGILCCQDAVANDDMYRRTQESLGVGRSQLALRSKALCIITGS